MSGNCRHAFGGVPEGVVHRDSSLVLPLMRPFMASSYFQSIPPDKELLSHLIEPCQFSLNHALVPSQIHFFLYA
jgi:hypothetical protein